MMNGKQIHLESKRDTQLTIKDIGKSNLINRMNMTFSIDKANQTQRPHVPSELGGLKLFGYHGRKDYLFKHFN